MKCKRPADLVVGDILELATETLRVEAPPELKGHRVVLTVRTSEDGCGLSRRAYLLAYIFNVREAA